ncbi:hypothetical protein CR513_01668, partial [Mucuna pruriens]
MPIMSQEKTVPLPFPTRTISARKPESDEELLRMFRKVEIDIPLLDAIKQIPKKKMKASVKIGGVQALPKKCRDPKTFSVPCTIGDCTFADAMLDLGASINVMPISIYKFLNFGDLEPTRMTIQLANRSVVQPFGVLEDVLVQVDELIFLVDFYVLDMEDETSGKGSTLILGRPFLMTARIKIDMHVGMLSMEFVDTLVQFNIFEAMKHPTEDHSLFGIELINELVEECLQLDNSGEDNSNFGEDTVSIGCLWSLIEEADYNKVWEVYNLLDSEDDNIDPTDLRQEVELIRLLDQVRKYEDLECSKKSISANQGKNRVPLGSDFSTKQGVEPNSNSARVNSIPAKRSWPQQPKAELMSTHLVPSLTQVGHPDLKVSNENSSFPPPPMELKPLPNHLKYA